MLAIDGSKFRAVNARDRRLANSRVVVRIVPYPACELPGTAQVPSSRWLDASNTKDDTWNKGKQIPIQHMVSAKAIRQDSEFTIARSAILAAPTGQCHVNRMPARVLGVAVSFCQ